MAESMIERVVEAICTTPCGKPCPHCFDKARAVYAAMREPSKGMFVRGGIAIEDSAFGEGNIIFDAAADCWRAMIDKALEEGK